MNKLIHQIKNHFPNLVFTITDNTKEEDIEQGKYYVSYEGIEGERCAFYSGDTLSKINKEHIIKWTT